MTFIVLAGALLAIGAIAALSVYCLQQMRQSLADIPAALGARLDTSGTQLNARLDGVTAQVNERLDVVTAQLNQRLRDTTDSLDRRLAETVRVAQDASRTMGERLETVSRVVGDVHAGLGQMGEASKRIFEVGQDIASLQDILRAPKLRGGLSELWLSEVLAQILTPEHYELQHRFRSGETVDAVVRLGPGLVPVDAKFPLESFRRLLATTDEAERQREKRQFTRDVKRHIDAIAKKYILPDEDTFGFALMYIPAENVYYEVILRDDALGEGDSLLQHALNRHVIPVSPSSFYAYLQSILLGLRGMRIEQRAREITSHLERLQGDFSKFGDCFDTLGKHLKNAQNTFDRAEGMRKKLEVKLETSAQLGAAPAAESGRAGISGAPAALPSPEIPLFPLEEDAAEAADALGGGAPTRMPTSRRGYASEPPRPRRISDVDSHPA